MDLKMYLHQKKNISNIPTEKMRLGVTHQYQSSHAPNLYLSGGSGSADPGAHRGPTRFPGRWCASRTLSCVDFLAGLFVRTWPISESRRRPPVFGPETKSWIVPGGLEYRGVMAPVMGNAPSARPAERRGGLLEDSHPRQRRPQREPLACIVPRALQMRRGTLQAGSLSPVG